MIYEGVITTSNADGSAHVTPMGFRREGDEVEVAPFVPSTTLDNLRRHPQATLNLTDDVRIVAGALTGRREWPVARAVGIDGWRLLESLAHWELEVTGVTEDAERPRFRLAVREEQIHGGFPGFNRAQAAVIEAAILVSRLDWLDPAKLAAEMAYLRIAIDKTAGPRERTAWQWLLEATMKHPRHRLRLDENR